MKPKNKTINDRVDPTGTVANEDDGFTLVRKRKSESRQSNSGMWNNQRQFSNNSWNRRNMAGAQPNSRTRQNGNGMVNTYERNIVSNHNRVNGHEDMGTAEEVGEKAGQINTSNHTPERVVNEPGLKGVMQGTQGKGKSIRTLDIQLVETSNRFLLLDEDGNEMVSYIEGREIRDQYVHQPEERNAGWIKKQERTLNKDYSSQVNQDQRFEAKSGLETNDVDMVNEIENKEEVESEKDATAMMMKSDDPILPNEDGPTVVTENSKDQNQPPVVMLEYLTRLMHMHGVSLCGVIESHLTPSKIWEVCNKVFNKWEWISEKP
ncbi:hypothetical protein L1987_56712 [Smallanthus sonchifolius]|uniref:Uncharacterized protein n=1 Tax=Smallanthus sonchifolius TaxID=185202 RepID=A0ACB9EE63_9ASTR|nr:hypothetical protein L1987_56712 [Smallanthus sonchifolius]